MTLIATLVATAIAVVAATVAFATFVSVATIGFQTALAIVLPVGLVLDFFPLAPPLRPDFRLT